MDELQQENLELVRKLAAQEEALSYSNRQLDQRSAECQAQNRQLEAALSDVREQVRPRSRSPTRHLRFKRDVCLVWEVPPTTHRERCSDYIKTLRLYQPNRKKTCLFLSYVLYHRVSRSEKLNIRPLPEKKACRQKSWSLKLRRAERKMSWSSFTRAS